MSAEEMIFRLNDVVAKAVADATTIERERCAMIASRIAEAYLSASRMSLPVEPSPVIAKDRAEVARVIAATIRDGIS
jgi:hypothetical protein